MRWIDWGRQRGLTSKTPGGETGGREGSERIYSTVEKRDRGTQSPGKETERSGELEAQSREWGLVLREARAQSPGFPDSPSSHTWFLPELNPVSVARPRGLAVCMSGEHCPPLSHLQISLHLHLTRVQAPRVCHPLLAPAIREKETCWDDVLGKSTSKMLAGTIRTTNHISTDIARVTT